MKRESNNCLHMQLLSYNLLYDSSLDSRSVRLFSKTVIDILKYKDKACNTATGESPLPSIFFEKILLF